MTASKAPKMRVETKYLQIVIYNLLIILFQE